jgi:hypothetical protein
MASSVNQKPRRFSRSTLELFMNCPRCFYLAHRKNIKTPAGYPLTLNNAVDKLLKAEFDIHREAGTVHPMLQQSGLTLIPFKNDHMTPWRQNRKGIEFQRDEDHVFCGAVDDVWLNSHTRKLHVADYKATARATPVTAFDPETQPHHRAYARQLEFYTWLLQKLHYDVDEEAYLVYATGDSTRDTFDSTLHFQTHVLTHRCELAWIDPALENMLACYYAPTPPEPGANCATCRYVTAYLHAVAPTSSTDIP